VFEKEITRASGLARSTTAAPQMIDAAAADDSSELTQWMTILDEQQEYDSEISSFLALQRLSERMESQAGRVVSNEFLSDPCEDEINANHWRVQSLAQ
jgi:hypothetical protein